MARKVEAAQPDAVWYTPDIAGNREDPDPFQVQIRPMSAEDMLRAERESGKLTGRAWNPAKKGQEHVAAVIEKRVVAVRGYSVVDPKTGETITPTDGESLLRALKRAPGAEYRLVVDDVFGAIEDASKLSEGIEKK